MSHTVMETDLMLNIIPKTHRIDELLPVFDARLFDTITIPAQRAQVMAVFYGMTWKEAFLVRWLVGERQVNQQNKEPVAPVLKRLGMNETIVIEQDPAGGLTIWSMGEIWKRENRALHLDDHLKPEHPIIPQGVAQAAGYLSFIEIKRGERQASTRFSVEIRLKAPVIEPAARRFWFYWNTIGRVEISVLMHRLLNDVNRLAVAGAQ